MIIIPARRESSSIGGNRIKRNFTVDGDSKPFWSPPGLVYGKKSDAEDKAKRLKEAGEKYTRITKEKAGYRVWSRGSVRNPSKKKKK